MAYYGKKNFFLEILEISAHIGAYQHIPAHTGTYRRVDLGRYMTFPFNGGGL